ncbi:MAG: UPF0147 family protein [archaeon]
MKKKEIDTSYLIELMDSLIQDTSVPRNIRKVVDDSKQKIENQKELSVNISSAIYLLDDISNDINMPAHARTDIWTIISELEKLKESTK